MRWTCGTSNASISHIVSPYAKISALSVMGTLSNTSLQCHGSDPTHVCFGFLGPDKSSFKNTETLKPHNFTCSKSPLIRTLPLFIYPRVKVSFYCEDNPKHKQLTR